MKEIYADIEKKQALYRFKETHKDRFMLRFDHADGRIIYLPYNHLSGVRYIEGSVRIDYIHTTVEITGSNLANLCRAIGRREAGQITEKHSPRELSLDKCHITNILISKL